VPDIWYSPPSTLLAVPNVTAHPSTARAPSPRIAGPLFCGFKRLTLYDWTGPPKRPISAFTNDADVSGDIRSQRPLYGCVTCMPPRRAGSTSFCLSVCLIFLTTATLRICGCNCRQGSFSRAGRRSTVVSSATWQHGAKARNSQLRGHEVKGQGHTRSPDRHYSRLPWVE